METLETIEAARARAGWTISPETYDDAIDFAFVELAVEHALHHVRKGSVPVREWTLDDLTSLGARVLKTQRNGTWNMEVIAAFDDDGAVCELSFGSGELSYRVAASTGEVAARLGTLLGTTFAGIERVEEVDVTYWSPNNHGCGTRTRTLSPPSWKDVAGNYPQKVRTQLGDVMQASAEQVGGIAIWQGPPGTGKTSAIRALIGAWSTWCDAHVVTEPDVLVGPGGESMIDRLFGDNGDRGDRYVGEEVPAEPRTRLVILEDAGDLIAIDARAGESKALSRLLNISDGLMGQDLPISIVITTNEPLGRLHPAVLRAGRCWSRLVFPNFNTKGANEWLRTYGVKRRLKRSTSLADLYAIQQGREIGTPAEEPEPMIGFGRALPRN